MPELQYHPAIFHLLGVEPVVSAEQQAFIAERERLCGVRFPAAVTEWMSIRGVENLFYNYTNNDFLPSSGGGPDWAKNWPLGAPEQTKQGYLCIASENQGVVFWYVRLDEGEDPPVYHDNGETVDDEHLPLADVTWERVSDTYSNFIYHLLAPREQMSSVHSGFTYLPEKDMS